MDPATTWIDVDVELAPDVTILPNTQLKGATVVATGATVGPDTTLTDVEVGAGATVIRTHGSLAVIGEGASVGPFAYLRPGTQLGRKGKIGTFVETKNAEIGEGSKVPHLSYVGDATIGEHTNIGAATVTVNYDGVHKHRTVIGSHARTGADNMFVAPVKVGDGAYTAAGVGDPPRRAGGRARRHGRAAAEHRGLGRPSAGDGSGGRRRERQRQDVRPATRHSGKLAEQNASRGTPRPRRPTAAQAEPAAHRPQYLGPTRKEVPR